MKEIKHAFDIIMGTEDGKTAGYYMAGFFFCFLAIMLSMYLSGKKRNPESPNTPVKYSLLFAVWDNFKRISVSFMVIFIFFRVFDLSAIPAMMGVGFFVALGLDKAIEFMMNNFDFFKFLKSDRDNFPVIPKKED